LAAFFRAFNAPLAVVESYSRGEGAISRKAVMLAVHGVLVLATVGLFKAVPGGLRPRPGQYLIGFAQLIRRGHAGPHRRRDPPHQRQITWRTYARDCVPGLSINGFHPRL
jgi:multidrug efflux pump